MTRCQSFLVDSNLFLMPSRPKDIQLATGDVVVFADAPRAIALFIAAAMSLALPMSAIAATESLACPSPHVTHWTERAMRADCEICWVGGAATVDRGRSSLNGGSRRAAASSSPATVDWIVPAGSDAPMALVALPEASERFAASDLSAQSSAVREHVLPARAPIEVSVHTGPGWKGYIAVEMSATRVGRRVLPPGAQAYVALTEDIAAGTEGTSIERHVVRAVVGPLPLEDLATRKGRVNHVHALNVPESARPERLSSIAWVQTPDGKVIAVANSIPAGCPGAP